MEIEGKVWHKVLKEKKTMKQNSIPTENTFQNWNRNKDFFLGKQKLGKFDANRLEIQCTLKEVL